MADGEPSVDEIRDQARTRVWLADCAEDDAEGESVVETAKPATTSSWASWPRP
jgi:hypothetical protein